LPISIYGCADGALVTDDVIKFTDNFPLATTAIKNTTMTAIDSDTRFIILNSA
jgi:hypothetical protein